MKFLDSRMVLDTKRFRDNNGFLTIKDNPITRTGVFNYKAKELGDVASHLPPEKIVGVYRSADEVFKEESLDSFNNALVTDNHPPEMVNPRNQGKYNKGYLQTGTIRQIGENVVADLHIVDADLIAKVYDGKSELSNGYYSDLKESSGVADGLPYDFVQTNIRGNHIAVVAKGRAGSTCRLSDAAMVEDIQTKKEDTMSEDNKTSTYLNDSGEEITIVMDGMQEDIVGYVAHLNSMIKSLEQDKEKALCELQTQMDTLADAKAEVEEALASKDKAYMDSADESILKQTELQTLLDSANESITELRDKEMTPEKVDTLVRERCKLIDDATKLYKDITTEGKSNLEIKQSVIGKRVPSVDAASASEETLDAVMTMLIDGMFTPKSNTLRNALMDSATTNVQPAQKRDFVREARENKINNK